MGIKRRIGCQVPLQYIFTPVARSTHDYMPHMPFQIIAKLCITTGPLFCKIEVLVRVCIVHQAESAFVTPVQMKSGSVNVLSCRRI